MISVVSLRLDVGAVREQRASDVHIQADVQRGEALARCLVDVGAMRQQ